MTMVTHCRRTVERSWFQNGVLAVIVLNALLIGLATDPAILASRAALFRNLNALIQVIFVVEIDNSPRRWNLVFNIDTVSPPE